MPIDLSHLEQILVVDDDPRLRTMLAEQLELAGLASLQAADAEAALALAARPEVALVLLDVMMPGVSGLELLGTLRGRPGTARLPVILLTARSQVGDKLEGLELGADDYVTKPFDSAELLARVRVQLRLRRLRAQVEERNAELVRFAAAVAHEVRAPLHELSLQLDAAAAEAADRPAALAALTRAEGALRRTAEVLDAHLEVARAGQVPEPREPVDLGEALRDAAEQVRVSQGLPGFEPRVEGPPLQAAGNATLLRELLRNLLENAVRHAGPVARVAVAFHAAEGALEVVVEDDGPGVPAGLLPNLFEPFRSGGSGSGLGLAIARRIARGHGGDLVYEPAAPGARFRLTLPSGRG
ncbi:MAG: hybrid sensor histidine kinase/response regulator [Myxococcales bacterium]